MTTDSSAVIPTSPPAGRIEWWTLGAITAAFVALVTFWGILTPIYDAPDEPLHLNSSIRLAEGWEWPDPGTAEVQNKVLAARGQQSTPAAERSTFAELAESHPGYHGVDQMTQHPPLYYAYTGVVLRVIDFLEVRADQALLAVRLAGLIFVLPLPFFLWESVRRPTGSPKAAIVAAATVFAVPQLAHIMGSASNDSATIAFSCAVMWLGIRIMTGDTRWITTIGLGLALALALFTKGTAVPLVAFAGLVLLLWPRELALSQRLIRTAAAMAVALLGGWWWVRNLLVFGRLQPAGLRYPDNPFPDGQGPSITWYIDQMWGRVSLSFWGNFGWLNHPMPVILTDILTVVALAVVVGFAFRRSAVRWRMVLLASMPLLFLVGLITQTWPTYVRTQLPAGMQGRYFFVVLVPLVVLSAVAWLRLVSPGRRRATGIGLLSVFAAIGLAGIVVEFRAVYTGIGDWLAHTPSGIPAAVGITVVAAALAILALVMSIRFIRTDLPAVTDGADTPRDDREPVAG